MSTVDLPKLCGTWQSGHLWWARANESSESPHGECSGAQSGLGGQLGANCTVVSSHVP